MKKVEKLVMWNIRLSNGELLGTYSFPRTSIKKLFPKSKIKGQDLFLV